jgi:hypothetical protein
MRDEHEEEPGFSAAVAVNFRIADHTELGRFISSERRNKRSDKRWRFLLGVMLGFVVAFGIAAYYAYASFYNQILEESALTRVRGLATTNTQGLKPGLRGDRYGTTRALLQHRYLTYRPFPCDRHPGTFEVGYGGDLARRPNVRIADLPEIAMRVFGVDGKTNGLFGMQNLCYIEREGTTDGQHGGRGEDGDQ